MVGAHPARALGPRRCCAVGAHPTKALRWGLGSALQCVCVCVCVCVCPRTFMSSIRCCQELVCFLFRWQAATGFHKMTRRDGA